jgi:hypothetical protein
MGPFGFVRVAGAQPVRHTVHLLVDEVPRALSAAARLLALTRYPVERLTVSAGTFGRAKLTAVVTAPDDAPVCALFAEAMNPIPRKAPPVLAAGGLEPRVPYQWQADGAGDEHVG